MEAVQQQHKCVGRLAIRWELPSRVITMDKVYMLSTAALRHSSVV